jgi:hypothetical protein
MRKLAFMGVFVMAIAFGCKDDDEGEMTPIPLPELKVSSSLTGANAIPSNTSLVTGDVDGTLNQDTRILKLNIMYNDSLDSTYADTAFIPVAWHIYKGTADSIGTSVINLGTTFATPFAFTDTLTAEQVTDLKAGAYYVNIHSAKFPNGEIRGQLRAAE